MIPSIQNTIRSLQNVQKSLDGLVIEFIKENESMVLDMNTGQIYAGKESTGKPITPEYRPLTIQIKTGMGQPTDRVTLKDTGDFHGSFFINYGPNWFTISADDVKTQKIEKKYGVDIYGLDEKNMEEIIKLLKDHLIVEVKKMLLQ